MLKCVPIAALTTFGLYGSKEFEERAMFFMLNHAAVLKSVPRFPGSEI